MDHSNEKNDRYAESRANASRSIKGDIARARQKALRRPATRGWADDADEPTCPECSGTGELEELAYSSCPACSGSGIL